MRTLNPETKVICISFMLIMLLMLFYGCKASNNKDTGNNQPDDQNKELKKETRNLSYKVSFSQEELDALNAIGNNEFPEFLGKTFDPIQARNIRDLEKKGTIRHDNPNFDLNIELRETVIQAMLGENFYNRLLYSDSMIFNYESLLNDGLLAIIPRNPYTGVDVKSSLNYSPGDVLLAVNDQGGLMIQHLGNKEGDYDSNATEYTQLRYQKGSTEDELLTDGRTLYTFHKFEDDELDDLYANLANSRKSYFKGQYSPEYVKIWWLQRQIQEMFTRYAQNHKDVLSTLDDYLNYYGRRNPAAWVNPYNNLPMKQVGWVDVAYGSPPVPDSYFETVDDVASYAGNYSFAKISDSKGDKVVFALYYLDSNGNLIALSCTASPKK